MDILIIFTYSRNKLKIFVLEIVKWKRDRERGEKKKCKQSKLQKLKTIQLVLYNEKIIRKK